MKKKSRSIDIAEPVLLPVRRIYEDAVSSLLEDYDTGLRANIKSDFPVAGMPLGTLGYDATFGFPEYRGRASHTVQVYFTWNSHDDTERDDRFRELFNFLISAGAHEPNSLSISMVWPSFRPGIK